jgi:acylphosphatase
MKQAFAVTLIGRVQNVGFRFATVEKAQEIGIKGFVKNKTDGTVYIEAEGEANDLNRFLEWCKEGPPAAKVENAETQEIPIQEFTGFNVK